jgi:acetyl esterase/lipase
VLEMGHEGYKVAEKLQDLGITAVVLKYRHYDVSAARQDGQRAIRFVRSKAKEWGIDEHKIGIGGFSAGAHLALNAAATLKPKEDWTPDAIDKIDKKPDFLMLIYAGYNLSEEASLDRNLPPVFLALSADDQFDVEEPTLLFFHKLLTLKVPAELHIYQRGGHGYGLGWDGCQCDTWPNLFRNWLVSNNFIKS